MSEWMEVEQRGILGLFSKWPEVGKVKTRLSGLVGPEMAARIAMAFLQDTLHLYTSIDVDRYVVFAPESARERFHALTGDRFQLVPQSSGNLGTRLSNFFRDRFEEGASEVVVTGSDSPTLPRSFLNSAFLSLRSHDVVLGPAMDGGYYLIGMRQWIPSLFEGIDWSTSKVLSQTIDRIRHADCSLHLLQPWYDVDTPEAWQMLIGHIDALAVTGNDRFLAHTKALIHELE